MGLLSGCGEAPPPAPPPAPPQQVAFRPRPAEPPAPPPPASTPAPTPPAPTPRQKHEAVLLERSSDALLFEDEEEHLDDVAREALEAQSVEPLTLVSKQEMSQLKLLAASGRARPGGPACRRRPSFERVIRLNHPGAYGARRGAHCALSAVCSGGIEIRKPREGMGDWGSFLEWPKLAGATANVNDVTSVAAFEKMLRTTPWEPQQPGNDDVLGGALPVLKRMAPPNAPRHARLIESVESAGPWPSPGPQPQDFHAAQAQLDACPRAPETFESSVLLAVSEAGAVTRCEAHDDDKRSPGEACLCKAASARSFPAGAAGRRARLQLLDTQNGLRGVIGVGGGGRGSKRTKVEVFARQGGNEFVQEDFTVIREAAAALGRCFQLAPSERKDDLELRLRAEESGTVTGAFITHGADEFTDQEQTCILAWSKKLTFSCSSVDAGEAATLHALLTVLR